MSSCSEIPYNRFIGESNNLFGKFGKKNRVYWRERGKEREREREKKKKNREKGKEERRKETKE